MQHDPVSSSGAGHGSDDADGLATKELKRVELIKRLEMLSVPTSELPTMHTAYTYNHKVDIRSSMKAAHLVARHALQSQSHRPSLFF